MYAIVNIAGQQFKVEKDQKIYVHRLEGKEGDSLNFDEVLLIDNDKNILVGEPTLKGARIVGKVLSHAKGDKVKVFKKKRRKGYKVLNGHRQYLTEIQIQSIIEKGAEKAPAKATTAGTEKKAATPKKDTPVSKTTTKKPAATQKTTGAQKTSSPQKAAEPKKTETAKKATATKKTAGVKKTTATKKTAAAKKTTAAKKK